MVATVDKRPWLLVGPWYRWQRPGVPSTGRASRPVFQKYDSPKLVEEFLADPQRSLKFTADDFVHKVTALPKLVPEFLNNKPRRQSPNKYDKTETRKLFLDTHKRFYLIVCELHCDGTGFPTATRDQVCEAGFVVRRRASPQITAAAAKEVKPILAGLGAARGLLKELNEVEPGEKFALVKKGLAAQGEAMLKGAVAESVDKSKAVAIDKLNYEKANLDAWAAKYGVAVQLQGWRTLRDRVGQWVKVEEKPAVLTEQVFPLYPLIPDPRELLHSAKGRNIYFGLVPTGSADTDDFGHARFDATTGYEIRCYVRRHKPDCPVKTKKPDCHGELVWSAPTEVYQIASQFDLVGTSNRPVSMQLPDMEALQAQAAMMKPNQLAPFRMVPPNKKSNLEVAANKDGEITSHGTSDQICSFSIPLITIVATFVFKLFLPVVILLFGLFFLLKLKFCIPPSIEVSAEVKAELDAKAPSFDAEFDVSIDAKFDAGGIFGGEIHNVQTTLHGPEMTTGLESSNATTPGLGAVARAQMSADMVESSDEANAPSLTANLAYEAHVEAEVIA
ncbi:MAG: hypothetical protein WCF57_04820 [Pyrinomonadaceae bacterium]